MEDNYPKAYKELYEILKNIPSEDLSKIPKEVMHTIIDKKDDDYEFDFTGNIDNSNLLEETRALLAVIYKKYWTTPEERRRIEAKIKNDLK
mgnify:FL=1